MKEYHMLTVQMHIISISFCCCSANVEDNNQFVRWCLEAWILFATDFITAEIFWTSNGLEILCWFLYFMGKSGKHVHSVHFKVAKEIQGQSQ